MFVNHTNHPSERWSAEQISAAQVYGEILDIPFPAVDAEATPAQVAALVEENLEKILALKPAAVLCQGEFNYTFVLVERLKSFGVKVVAATSERATVDEILPDGSTRQVSTFRFVQFREY
ncbi:MAG: CRISPR-associated protein [Selenomonadaceae bacterium]|nr:CRISPR-associated protein [Selenomonadaceae bacterium]